MNHMTLRKCVLTASLVACSVISAEAHDIYGSQLLPGGSSCHHVIELIHLHGVNNSVNRANSSSMFHHSPFGSMVIPECELGDLEILQVNQVPHEDPACGPKFAVIVANQSTREVCNFHVSAVAVFGRICPTSPNATVKVDKICPGEALEVSIQLPLEALAMGNRNGQIIGFQKLVVAIDSYDELVETNEANNLQAFDVAAIPMVTPVVESVQEAVVEPVSTQTTETEVLQTTGPAQAIADPSAETADPTNDPLQSALQMLGTDGSSEAEAATAL